MKYNTWNIYSAVLLMETYERARKHPQKRSAEIIQLSQLLRKRAGQGKPYHGVFGSVADINYQLGKVESQMTAGRRGLPGALPQAIMKAVKMYQSQPTDYDRYLRAAHQNITVDELRNLEMEQGGRRGREKAIPLKEIEGSAAKKEEFVKPAKVEVAAKVEAPAMEEPKTVAAKKEMIPYESAESAPLLALDDSILDLHVSTRLENLLMRHHVKTIRDMLSYPTTEWELVKGMGAKSLCELRDILRRYSRIDPNQKPSQGPKSTIELADEAISYDMPIGRAHFGTHVDRVLASAGFQTLGEVLHYPMEKWAEMSALGTNSLAHLVKEIEVYRQAARTTAKAEREKRNSDISKDQLREEAEAMEDFADMLMVTYEHMMRVAKQAEAQDIPLAEGIWQDETIQKAAQNYVHRLLVHEKYEGASFETLSEDFPHRIFDETAFGALLDSMEKQQLIWKQGKRYYCVYPSLETVLPSVCRERNAKVLKLRLSGLSLKEVAGQVGLTRECVRQIQKRIFSKLPPVREGYIAFYKQKYVGLTDDDFQYIFQLTEETRHFISLYLDEQRVKEKDVDAGQRLQALRAVMHDQILDAKIRERADARLKAIDPYFLIDGKHVMKNRQSLIRFAIKRYCQDAKPSGALLEDYLRLLDSLSVSREDPRFSLNVRYIEHYFPEMTALVSRHRQVRYYDILSMDYQDLLDTLQLTSYSNVEISSRKFFRDFPEIMERYDIRDEYELHNLLKKLWAHGHYNDYLDDAHRMTFGRMPTLKIGHADRRKQVVDIIQEHGYISYMDLGCAIEEAYGVPQNAAMANGWGETCKEYFDPGTGMFHIPETFLPEDKVECMKKRLPEDFYLMQDILDTYLEEYPEGNVWDIDPAAVRQMGFISHRKYVIRDTYSSAKDFFKKLFVENEILDLRDHPEYAVSSMFSAAWLGLAKDFKVVETEPGVFCNSRYLEKHGITQEAIHEFCEKVYHFIENGKCFSIRSLRAAGFDLPWQEEGWGDWFYGSLLAADYESFNSQKYGSGHLLRKRQMQRKLSMADLVEEIVNGSENLLTTSEISGIIEDTYGIEFPPFKVKEIVESNDDTFCEKVLY